MKFFKINDIQPSTFVDEAKRYNLKFRCQDCIHLNTANMKCSFEYPNDDLLHLDEYVNEKGEFIFCKYFELT
jgi:hypothetical protein